MSTLQQEKVILTSDGLSIEDVHLCSRFFNQLHYSHVKREGNKITHILMRYGLHISNFFA